MKEKQSAASLFDQGYNCAQSVLLAWADRNGVDGNDLVRAAGGFGAGMGRLQETCGAVTGGMMALGMRFAVDDPADKQARDACYGRVRDLNRRFTDAFGTTLCRELLGCDLRTEEGQKRFAGEQLITRVCRRCVETADGIVAQLETET